MKIAGAYTLRVKSIILMLTIICKQNGIIKQGNFLV